MNQTVRAITLLSLTAVAACGTGDPLPTNTGAETNVALTSAPGAPMMESGPTTASNVAGNEVRAALQPAAGAPSLAVDSEGLRLFRASGSALPIPFGTARAEALRMLQFRGPPGTGTQEECSSGPLTFAVWPDGLKLYFQKDRFTGWALDKRARGAVATAAGVGPGVTRSSVEKSIVIKVAQTSLGNEFSSGDLNGLFDGPAADSQVTDMWAGTSCIFR